MKKTFKIEVDCANCANLVESEIQNIEGINAASLSFMTQKMKIDFAEDADTDAVTEEIIRRARRIEPDFCIL